MKRTLSSLPFAASVCKNPWTAFQTDVGPPVRTPPKMQRLLLRSKVPPFLHTIQRSLQLPTQSLFFSLELLSLWTNTIFKQPPYLYQLSFPGQVPPASGPSPACSPTVGRRHLGLCMILQIRPGWGEGGRQG